MDLFFKTIFCPKGFLLSILITAFTATTFAEVSLFGGLGFESGAPGSHSSIGIMTGIRAEDKGSIFLFSELSYIYIDQNSSNTYPTINDTYEKYTYKNTSNNLTLSGGAGIRIGSVAIYTAPLLFIPLSHRLIQTYESEFGVDVYDNSPSKPPFLSVYGGLRVKVYNHISIDLRLTGRTPQTYGMTFLLLGYTF